MVARAAGTSSAPRSRPSRRSSPPTSACATAWAWPTAPTRSRSPCARWAWAPATRWCALVHLLRDGRGRARRSARAPVFCDVDPDTFCVTARDRRGRAHAAHQGDRARCTCSATSRRWPSCASSGLPVLEDAAQAAGATLDGAQGGRAGRRRHVLLLPLQEPALPGRRRRDRHRRRRGGRAGAPPALPRLRRQGDLRGGGLQLAPRRAAGRGAARAAARARRLERARRRGGRRGVRAAGAGRARRRCRGRSTGAEHAYHLYVVRHSARTSWRRARRRGVGARGYYRVPVHRQPAMARFAHGAELPGHRGGRPHATWRCRWARSSPRTRSARWSPRARLGRPDQQPPRARHAPADRGDARGRARGGGHRARLRADARAVRALRHRPTRRSAATAAGGWPARALGLRRAQRRARPLGAAAALRRGDGPRLQRRDAWRPRCCGSRAPPRSTTSGPPSSTTSTAGLARAVVVPEAIPPERLDRYGAQRQAAPLRGAEGGVLPGRLRARRAVLGELGLDRAGRSWWCARRPRCRSTTASRTRSSGAVLERLRGEPDRGAARARPSSARSCAGSAAFVVPERAVDAQSLVAFADLVVSAGGTMNREAVALGTPVFTTFEGRLGAVDEGLLREGRLRRLEDPDAGAASRSAREQDARRGSGATPANSSNCCSRPPNRVRSLITSSVNARRLGQVGVDACLVALAYYLAYVLRFDAGIPHRYEELLQRHDRVRRGDEARGLRAVRALLQALALRRPEGLRVDRQGGRGLELRADRASLFLLLARRARPAARGIALDFLLTLALRGRRALPGARGRSSARCAGRWCERAASEVLIVGAGNGGQQVALELRRNPELSQRADRLRGRRPAQAGHAHRGLQGARRDRRPAARARRRRARRGDHRDPLGAGRAAPEGGHRLPRARHPGAHAAHDVRAALAAASNLMRQVREVQVEDVLGPRARARRDRPRGRLPARPDGAGHRRRRLDRRRSCAARSRAWAPSGSCWWRTPRTPVRDPPRARGGAPLRARRRRAGRLQGRHAHARGVRRAPALGRLPRRRLQARAADGGEPGRGGAQQRGGHAHRGRRGGRGRRRALRARLDRQGREPGHGDGRLQGAGRVGGRGGPAPLQGHPLRHGALRQRARLVGLGGADLPPPDRRGRPGHRHRREDDALLHDDPRGGAADHPLGRAGHRRRGVRARDGRPGARSSTSRAT